MKVAVDFLKVGHHGSKNATPPPKLLENILPEGSPSLRLAAVSTYNETYTGVPDESTLEMIRTRAEVRDTRLLKNKLYMDIEFEG